MKRFAPWLAVLVALTLAACSQRPSPALPSSTPLRTADVPSATELFFSEYIEGSSNNKALEIFNGTGGPIDLAAGGYNVQMFFNGNPSPGLTIDLTGTVADRDVFVLANGNADGAILARADQTNSSGWFNGDDAVVLRKGSTIIDAIGQVGSDPGSEWGNGATSTQDNTLRRQDAVCAGDTDATDAFDPSAEWDGFANNTFDGLGSHAGCGGTLAPPSPIGTCGEPATPIHDVQGSGPGSPIVGETVNVEAVVVGDFQGAGQLNGFFLQEEDADTDADAATSEGAFVYAPGQSDLDVGDLVRVRGRVSEYNGLTEIGAADTIVCATGQTPPTAAEVNLPVSSLSDFEAVEGMRVELPGPLTITEYFNFDRFGEIVLAAPTGDLAHGDRLYQPTALEAPGPNAADALAGLPLTRITLDDGRSVQNPDPARHPNGHDFTLDNRFRGGDTLENVVGVMDYQFGLYRIQPTGAASYTADDPRPAAPDPVGGGVHVAGANVLNYFTTIDTGAPSCGPLGNQDCRGADTADELARQRAKIVAALSGLGADVIGLTEIQNPTLAGPDDALLDLARGLNDATSAGTFAAIETGTIGTDAIKVALVYRPAVVTPLGTYAILDGGVDPRFDDTKNRPALAQTFEENATGQRFTVVVNHLKSKGSACDDVGDPDTGDGQGNCNLTRTAAAEALVDWVASDPTGSGDPDVLMVGDYNSYDHEDPIAALVDGGFTDLLRSFQGEYAYTYVFDGLLGYLDYGLGNAALEPQVTGATAWHINADEPDLLDYDTTFKGPAQDALYRPDAYRASDHDPVLVGLDLTGPACTAARPSQDTLWPPNHKFAPIAVRGVTSAGGHVTVTVTGIRQDEPVDAPGDLDGNTAPDGQGVGSDTAEVRAERLEGGNGRVYRVAFTATDAAGQTCAGDVVVGVPPNRGRHATAIEDAPLYDATQP